MRIRRNRDNKIKIPWYRRRVTIRRLDQVEFIPADFGFRFPFARARPQPVRVAEPVTQPATQPVTEPASEPVRVPDPTMQPVPVPDVPGIPVPGRVPGIPVPGPVPGIPVPGRVPGIPVPGPVPGRLPQADDQTPYREPVPQLPGYDWEAHFRRILEQYEETIQGAPKEEPAPVTASENPLLKAFQMIMQPVLYLVIGREIVNHYVEAKITDPIYSKMLDDPVLGAVLREAEKANMDVEKLANYFANYDWDHFDLEEVARDLTIIVGAAGAARLIVFFIGRKVVFRI